jgi:hypothetical protein
VPDATRSHIGRSGRRLTVGPGHVRTGTQIARVRYDTGWLPWRLIRLPTIGQISRAISRVGRYRP